MLPTGRNRTNYARQLAVACVRMDAGREIRRADAGIEQNGIRRRREPFGAKSAESINGGFAARNGRA